MVKELRIIVACGSGVATSTIAVDYVNKILKEAGIKAKIVKCTLGEVPSKQRDADLVLTTSNYKKELDVSHMSVFGLISGVNADKVKTKLVETCNAILANGNTH